MNMDNGIQSNRSQYRKETLSSQFFRSCLGKIIILAAFIVIVLTVAKITVPSDNEMMFGTLDGVCQCIQQSHGSAGDASDDFVRNGIATFSHETDSARRDTILEDFHKFNKVEIYHHTFFSTSYIINNFNSRGERAAVGIFGLVIPTVNYNDFVLRTGPIRKDYNQKIIKQTITSDTYMGTTPGLDQ